MKKLSVKIATLIFLTCTQLVQAQSDVPYIVLVSFDGFRADYVKKLDLPNFKAFIKNGTQAEYMRPSFPSLTFPNHYTIVTGMNPGTHGLVDNTFYDPARKTGYSMGALDKKVDPYYYGGLPLWRLAKQSGIKSASYFWVGAELSDTSLDPDYFFPYVDSVSYETRIKQVFQWLQLPEKERPHFISLYFSSPDHESHSFGPWADETKEIIVRMDKLLGILMEGLNSTKLPINTILISDHGMAEVKVDPESYVFMDELLNLNDKSIVAAGGGTTYHIYVSQKNKIDSLYAVLKSKEGKFFVYKKTEFPREWHYQNDRVGDLLILAAPHHNIRRGGREAFLKSRTMGTMRGEHGFDPLTVDDMRAIFYAQGPNIQSGMTIPPFQNVDIFPLLARILKLKLPKIDGDPQTLKKVYKK